MEDTNTEITNPQGKPKQTPDNSDVVVLKRSTFNYFVIGAVFLVIGMILGFTIANQSGSGSASLDEASVALIVEQAMAELQTANQTLEAEKRFELVDDDPYMGAEDAPIVIVEFSDFRCPYCGRHFDQTLGPLLENYGQYIRYVYRDFAGLGPDSVVAALAANCAYDQGAFWEFHDQMFSNQDLLGRPFYVQLAEEFELDVDSFTECLDTRSYENEISQDIFDGQINGVQGTPGFFVNGTFVSGAQPYQIFEGLVLRELEKAGIDPTADDSADQVDSASLDAA